MSKRTDSQNPPEDSATWCDEAAAIWKGVGGNRIPLSPRLAAIFRKQLAPAGQAGLADACALFFAQSLYNDSRMRERVSDKDSAWWERTDAKFANEFNWTTSKLRRVRDTVCVLVDARDDKRRTGLTSGMGFGLVQFRKRGAFSRTSYRVSYETAAGWLAAHVGQLSLFAAQPADTRPRATEARLDVSHALTLAPPAVRIMQASVGFMPQGQMWQRIHAAIGTQPMALEKWSLMLAERLGAGKLVMNLSESLDQYRNNAPIDSSMESIAKLRRFIAVKAGMAWEAISLSEVQALINRYKDQYTRLYDKFTLPGVTEYILRSGELLEAVYAEDATAINPQGAYEAARFNEWRKDLEKFL